MVINLEYDIINGELCDQTKTLSVNPKKVLPIGLRKRKVIDYGTCVRAVNVEFFIFIIEGNEYGNAEIKSMDNFLQILQGSCCLPAVNVICIKGCRVLLKGCLVALS